MAKLFLFLTFLLLIHGCCLADHEQFQHNECQIQRLDVLEPNQRFQSEAGFAEFYDFNDQQFRCAGVEVVRHQIQPKGLLLPSYTTAPILFYIEHDLGLHVGDTILMAREDFVGDGNDAGVGGLISPEMDFAGDGKDLLKVGFDYVNHKSSSRFHLANGSSKLRSSIL